MPTVPTTPDAIGDALAADPGTKTPPPAGGLVLGPVTIDNPSPMEAYWRGRLFGAHPIPYDELTVRKSLRVYDAIYLNNETAAYAHNLKRMVRLSTGWSLQPPTDKEGEPLDGAEDVRDWCMELIERWDGDRFEEFLFQMLDGLRQGFKLAEIVTREGKIAGKRAWVIDDLLVRNGRWFAFDVDPAGRVKPDGILEYTGSDPDGGGIQSIWSPSDVARHAVQRFVRWTYNPLDSNAYSLYGLSEFRSLYRDDLLGDLMLKKWGETLDTYTHPVVIGIARQGLTSAQRTDFLEQLVQAAKRKGLVVPAEYLPEGMDPEKAIRLHEVQGKADDFLTISEHLDKKIMRAVMIGSLVSDVGDKGKGSFALGQQHVMLFLTVMDAIGRSLGRAIGQTLLRPLVRANLGDDAAALTPTMQFPDAGHERQAARAEMVTALVGAKVVDPTEPWIREFIGNLPPPPPEVIEVQEAERKLRVDTAKMGPAPHVEPGGGPPKGKAQGLAAGEDEDPRRAMGVGDIEAKIDLEAVGAGLGRRADVYARRLNDAWREVFRGRGGLAAQVRVALSRPEVPPLPAIRSQEVEDVFRRYAVESMVAGAVDAWSEVSQGLARQGREGLSAVAERLAEEEPAASPVAPVAARQVLLVDLREFARQHGVMLEGRMGEIASRIRLRQADLDAFAQNRLDEVRAQVEQQVAKLRAQAREMIVQAKAQGRRPSAAVRQELRELEEKWIGVESELAKENGALFDTLESSTYNEGRLRLYQASPAGAVIGLLYSSVLDDRTTRFCQVWDGYMAPRDHPVWRTVTPPNHWRCRAILVAVLAGERSLAQVQAAALRVPSEKPQAGFSGTRWVPPVAQPQAN